MTGTPLAHFTLFFVRQFARHPAALFWSFGFPLLAAALITPALTDSRNITYRIGLPAGLLPEELSSASCDVPTGPSHGERGISPGALLAMRLRCDPLFEITPVDLLDKDTAEAGAGSQQRAETRELTRIFASLHLHGLITTDGLLVPKGSGDPVLHRLLTTVLSPMASNGTATGEGQSENALVETDAAVKKAPSITAVPIAGLRFIDWFVPGLIGLGLMSTGLFFVASRIVQERQAGFFRRLQLTPFRRSDYILGFLIAFLLICFLQTMLLTLAFSLTSGFAINGSAIAWIMAGTLGGLSFGSLGLAIAARIRTVETAAGVSNVFYFPMMFLSGVYFAPAGVPRPVQAIVDLLPLSALNSSLREIAGGGTLGSVGPQLATLLAWVVATTLFAVKTFRWDTEA